MYAITIETTFAAAHAIRLPDDSLETLHGHDWRVWVTIQRPQLDAIETVMDFHDLQAMLARVVKPFRQMNLNDVEPFSDGRGGLAINPTAERVAWVIAQSLAEVLPEEVALADVRVEEAPGCVATYRP